MASQDKFDCIIVGAGPAGITAAYKLAENGLNVVVLERGTQPGAKNVMGGILFTTILNKLIPGFWKEAPLERRISSRRYCLLSEDTELSFSFDTTKYDEPPFNNSFTVLRTKFDQWFASKAQEAGAMVISGAVVDELLWSKTRCVGVKTRLVDGDLYADVVIIAEGANAVLSVREGLRMTPSDNQMCIAVKEIISLPEEVIEDRFCVSDGKGVAIECFGDAVKGMFGNGFIYTNRESLSVGIACLLSELKSRKIKPYELLDYFKSHSCIHCLLRGGKTEEYCAHLIPETGYSGVTRNLAGDGLMLVGDCAGLLNPSFFHEGVNLAMASGLMAAETVIEAKRKKDFSREALSAYRRKLENSFVLKDLRKFRKFPSLVEKHPEFLKELPDLFGELVTDYFAINGKTKAEIEKEVIRKFRQKIGFVRFSQKVFALAQAMGWA